MIKTIQTIFSVPSIKNEEFEMRAQPLQEGIIFKKDLPIEFEIKLTKNNVPFSEGKLIAFFKYNSKNLIWHEILSLKNGAAKCSVICEQSGFGNLHILFYLKEQEVFELIRGVAISPETLKRSYPRPSDFDTFWQEKLKTIPKNLEARFTKIDKNSHPHLHQSTHRNILEKDITYVDIEDIQINLFENSVSGILTRPKKRPLKSLPAILFLHGGGVRPCDPSHLKEEAEKGLIILDINAHGIANDQPTEWYQELKETGALKYYESIGREHRDNYYFLNMFLRVKRALDFLKSLPEWDQKTLITFGASQGCAQALAGAYLDEKVSAVVGQIPAYGDLTGFLRGRTVNFSDWLKLEERGRVDENIFKVAPYFDTVNFASKINKAGFFCFGLLDQGCTPLTNFIPINEYQGEATIVFQTDCYHNVCQEAQKNTWKFIWEHINKNKSLPST